MSKNIVPTIVACEVVTVHARLTLLWKALTCANGWNDETSGRYDGRNADQLIVDGAGRP
jgi:hypothetical protein